MTEVAAGLVGTPRAADDARAADGLPPLRRRSMAVFAVGDLEAGVVDTALGTFLLFYLTAVCGLSGSLTGLALFLSLTVDAVADPLIGYISDGTRSRWGRRHPFMLLSCIPLLLGLGLIFSVPPHMGQWALFAYATGCLLLLRLAHSAFSLPFAALGAEVSRDYRERSTLGLFRAVLNITGNVACVVLGFSVFLKGDAGLLDRQAYVGFGWTCAAIACAAMLLVAIGTLHLRGRMHEVAAAPPMRLPRFLAELRDVAGNRSFRTLFLTVLIFWVANGAAASLALHVSKFFWKLPNSVIQVLPICLAAGFAVGIALAALALRRLEKHVLCILALAAFCALQFAPIALRLTGVLTLTGAGLYALLYAVAFVTGGTMSCVVISFNAMMADTADEHEYLYGARREALYFSGITFSLKAAVGLGALVGGVALDVVGFPRELTSLGPQARIDVGAVRDLGLIAGPGAAMLAAVGVAVLTRYRLGARRHAEILAELARRQRA